MVIGFLGKGGSGKSTLSHNFVKSRLATGDTVLAIDADHNMDTKFNLGVEQDIPYLGTSLGELIHYVGLAPGSNYRDAFFSAEEPRFGLSPADAFTERYGFQVNPNLRLMAGGPHTDDVLYDKSCSHSLFTALKVYLPFLQLAPNEWAVVDEKAGSDGAGTGVATGLDYAVISVEPTRYGVKAASQIAEMLDFYDTPYLFAANKVTDEEDIEFINSGLSKPAEFIFRQEKSVARSGEMGEAGVGEMAKLASRLRNSGVAPESRKERSRRKFQDSRTYQGA